MQCSTLTAKEAADYIGVSYWSLLEECKRGLVPHLRFHRRVLFRKESLDQWLLQKEVESTKRAG